MVASGMTSDRMLYLIKIDYSTYPTTLTTSITEGHLLEADDSNSYIFEDSIGFYYSQNVLTYNRKESKQYAFEYFDHCTGGYISTDSTSSCISCPTGCSACYDATICVVCAYGWYLDTSFQC